MKLAAFDIEIAKVIPEGDYDWEKYRPLGISCAAIMLSDDNPRGRYLTHYTENPQLYKDECQVLVAELISLAEEGYTLVTVNGAGFDFQILAEESGLWLECADLALHHHCDLMLMSVCKLGWRTGLDAFAKGAGIESKLKTVELSDGRLLEGMDGAKAPELWAAGEYDAVMAYLEQDVRVTLGIAETAVKAGELFWRSGSGKPWAVQLDNGRLPIVAECLRWPPPDTSWMDDPPDPYEICGWALERRP